jgi:hypothetical protein
LIRNCNEINQDPEGEEGNNANLLMEKRGACKNHGKRMPAKNIGVLLVLNAKGYSIFN